MKKGENSTQEKRTNENAKDKEEEGRRNEDDIGGQRYCFFSVKVRPVLRECDEPSAEEEEMLGKCAKQVLLFHAR